MRNAIMKMQESLKEMGTLLSVVLNKQRFNLLPLDKMQWNSTLFYCGTLFLYMAKFLDFFGSTCKPATRNRKESVILSIVTIFFL